MNRIAQRSNCTEVHPSVLLRLRLPPSYRQRTCASPSVCTTFPGAGYWDCLYSCTWASIPGLSVHRFSSARLLECALRTAVGGRPLTDVSPVSCPLCSIAHDEEKDRQLTIHNNNCPLSYPRPLRPETFCIQRCV
jgi:hypothetical protein